MTEAQPPTLTKVLFVLIGMPFFLVLSFFSIKYGALLYGWGGIGRALCACVIHFGIAFGFAYFLGYVLNRFWLLPSILLPALPLWMYVAADAWRPQTYYLLCAAALMAGAVLGGGVSSACLDSKASRVTRYGLVLVCVCLISILCFAGYDYHCSPECWISTKLSGLPRTVPQEGLTLSFGRGIKCRGRGYDCQLMGRTSASDPSAESTYPGGFDCKEVDRRYFMRQKGCPSFELGLYSDIGEKIDHSEMEVSFYNGEHFSVSIDPWNRYPKGVTIGKMVFKSRYPISIESMEWYGSKRPESSGAFGD